MSDEAVFCKLFTELSALGDFRMWRDMKDGTWNVSVRFPAPSGVTAEVCSGFRHKTATIALQVMKDRLGGLQNMVNIAAPVAGISHQQVHP